MERIYIGSDKSGFTLKEAIKKHLSENDYDVVDLGMKDIEAPVPFYEAAKKVAQAVQKDDYKVKGICICGTGMGVSQVANMYKGIKAACVESVYGAYMCRVINDSNILCMGGWLIADIMGIKMVDTFLETSFTQDQEQWRCDFLGKANKEIAAIEDEIYK